MTTLRAANEVVSGHIAWIENWKEDDQGSLRPAAREAPPLYRGSSYTFANSSARSWDLLVNATTAVSDSVVEHPSLVNRSQTYSHVVEKAYPTYVSLPGPPVSRAFYKKASFTWDKVLPARSRMRDLWSIMPVSLTATLTLDFDLGFGDSYGDISFDFSALFLAGYAQHIVTRPNNGRVLRFLASAVGMLIPFSQLPTLVIRYEIRNLNPGTNLMLGYDITWTGHASHTTWEGVLRPSTSVRVSLSSTSSEDDGDYDFL